MNGIYFGWLILLFLLFVIWGFLMHRAIGRLMRQSSRDHDRGAGWGPAFFRALAGLFSDPSVMTERRQLGWVTILLILVIIGGPFVTG